ncbi:MAG: hypothetical protein U0Z26_06695 [Anaerolineales bacterium]
MNSETARITDVGKVAEELQAFDKLLASFCAAFDAEAKDCTSALGKIFLGAGVIRVTS